MSVGRDDKQRRLETLFDKAQGLPDDQQPLQMRSYGTMSQYRIAYEQTTEHLGAARQVLDWGCGNGHFSLFLRDQGLETTGYGYLPEPEFLKRDPSFRFVAGVEGDPVRLPFADESFDAVFSVGVLEHVHQLGGDQAGSARELMRILKPNGKLFVFHLPNKYGWIEFLVRRSNRIFGTKMHAHSRLYTERRFRDLFSGMNVRVVAKGRYNIFPRHVMNGLPAWIKNNRTLISVVNAVDTAIGRVLPALCQNWYFVVEKG
jgi:SAM-dependent methyltransferase